MPPFLILAVLATAARFTASDPVSDSESPGEGRADLYAQRSWAIIMRQTMASGYSVHLHFVQATNLLAVIDFTSESGYFKLQSLFRKIMLTSSCSRWASSPGLDENWPCNSLCTGTTYDVRAGQSSQPDRDRRK